jgi:hypothetical protein
MVNKKYFSNKILLVVTLQLFFFNLYHQTLNYSYLLPIIGIGYDSFLLS